MLLRTRWFGHIERMEREIWVRESRSLNINGTIGKGRPQEAWNQVAQGNLQGLHLEKGLALDRDTLRRISYLC